MHSSELTLMIRRGGLTTTQDLDTVLPNRLLLATVLQVGLPARPMMHTHRTNVMRFSAIAVNSSCLRDDPLSISPLTPAFTSGN